MRGLAGRLVAVCGVFCAVGLLVWLVWPSGGVPASGSASASTLSGSQSREAPPLGSFVVPSVQKLDGDQQALDAERARRASPSAFLARRRSRTEFAHLGAAQAARVAREAFPGLVEKRDGGAPELPDGETIRRFSTPDVAQVSLPHHTRAIVESTAPMQ